MYEEESLALGFTLIPLVIGTAGFLIAGEKVWNAAFYTVTMYVLNYGSAGELARRGRPLDSARGNRRLVCFLPYVRLGMGVMQVLVLEI